MSVLRVATVQPETSVDLESQEGDGGLRATPEARALSIIVPTFSGCADPKGLVDSYREAFAGHAAPLEIVMVGGPGTRERVAALEPCSWTQLVAVETSIGTGEDEALKLGLQRSRGDLILTIPGWYDVDPSSVPDMLAALGDRDMLAGSSVDPSSTVIGTSRSRVFHWSVRKLFGQSFHDLFCRVRLGRRDVFVETVDLGVRQHFVPVVAGWRGYDVDEITLPPATGTQPRRPRRRFNFRGHFRAMIDLLMLFFVLKFVDRPLRFFGLIGAPLLATGFLLTAYLAVERLVGATSLADRPLLILGVLLIVLGVQVIAIGLIGEIIVFTSNRRSRTYEVESVVRGETERQA